MSFLTSSPNIKLDKDPTNKTRAIHNIIHQNRIQHLNFHLQIHNLTIHIHINCTKNSEFPQMDTNNRTKTKHPNIFKSK